MSAEGTIGLLAVIVATDANLNWWFRGATIAVGLLLWGDLIFRMDRKILVRMALFAIGATFLLAVTWQSVWDDFHQKHPQIAARAMLRAFAEKATEAVHYINLPPARWTLAAIAVLLLIWGSRPVWRLWHHLISWLKSLLGEKVWIDKITAIELLKNSTWATLARMKAAKPRETYNNAFAILLGGQRVVREPPPNPQFEQLEFDAFIELTLDNFERDNPDYVKVDELRKKQYLEDKLSAFIKKALGAQVSDRFGSIPSGKV